VIFDILCDQAEFQVESKDLATAWSLKMLECTPSRRHVTVSLSAWSKLLALDVSIVFSL
jgi:hypothetical protein